MRHERLQNGTNPRAQRRVSGRVLTPPPLTTNALHTATDGSPTPPRCPADWGAIVVCGMPFGESPPFSDTHLPRALSRRRPVLVVDRPLPVHHWRPGHPPPLRHRLLQLGDQLWRLQPLAL